MAGDGFKTGAGDLDFSKGKQEKSNNDSNRNSQSTESSTSVDQQSKEPETRSDQVNQASQPHTQEYPYLVRRENVGDERDERIEVFLRGKVTSKEGEYRQSLAAELGEDSISKTDAREFALLYAFQNPEGVAELMREEGADI